MSTENQNVDTNVSRILTPIAAVMLLVAVAPLPYGYYQFLRWAVCGTAIITSYFAVEIKKRWILWMLVPIAILFNPLVPIHLTKDIWLPIDIIAAIIMLVSFFGIKEKKIS